MITIGGNVPQKANKDANLENFLLKWSLFVTKNRPGRCPGGSRNMLPSSWLLLFVTANETIFLAVGKVDH